MLLVVTGLKREAKIAQGGDVVTISGGGDERRLEQRLAQALERSFRGIVSFGVAGALSPALEPGDWVLSSQIIDDDRAYACHAGWLKSVATRLPGVRIGVTAAASRVLGRASDKAALFRRSGALAVDMESGIAARAAQARGLPFLALRTISDAADQNLPPAALHAMKPDGGLDGFAIARSLLANPAQIPALIRTGRDAEKAFAALLRGRGLLGAGFAFPDLG